MDINLLVVRSSINIHRRNTAYKTCFVLYTVCVIVVVLYGEIVSFAALMWVTHWFGARQWLTVPRRERCCS